ncbi:hypothetical protein ARMGADRAFT_1091474 [Armillaria gallica]|uniref:Uncharacterized protein n=1 Tax=Armillaria gallica TaxID=47427 RepID=A0A2H3CRY6_ARMGA|nr:hypothetical protein ARMGADRAFT_1091474 [Armillaria gallica]
MEDHPPTTEFQNLMHAGPENVPLFLGCCLALHPSSNLGSTSPSVFSPSSRIGLDWCPHAYMNPRSIALVQALLHWGDGNRGYSLIRVGIWVFDDARNPGWCGVVGQYEAQNSRRKDWMRMVVTKEEVVGTLVWSHRLAPLLSSNSFNSLHEIDTRASHPSSSTRSPKGTSSSDSSPSHSNDSEETLACPPVTAHIDALTMGPTCARSPAVLRSLNVQRDQVTPQTGVLPQPRVLFYRDAIPTHSAKANYNSLGLNKTAG